jgi:outer membrane protein TolC
MGRVVLIAASLLLAGAIPACSAPPPSLSELIAEAEANNPSIHAAEHDWRASTYVRKQVTTLPAPQFTIQEFSVGSPKPFAGFTTSNFAYIGIGASQQIPFPGKLRLKGVVADRSAGVARTQLEILRASIVEQVKVAYFHLAYLRQTLGSLEASRATLGQLIDFELSRYSTGQGGQADVLKAQLARTRLVREITMYRQQMGQAQADLKELLHRPQTSPDILAGELMATPLRRSAAELLRLTRERNPVVQLASRRVAKQAAELKSASRAGKPDFSLGYMYQRTGTDFPAYYMLTFGIDLPRRGRVKAEMAEAAESLQSARERLDGRVQQELAEVQKQYVTATNTAEVLTEYREGLLPQADAAFHAVLAEYESNQQQFSSVLIALDETLQLKRDYAQTLLDHETAIARLEALTGETLQ